MIILTATLVLSLALNIFFLVYVRWLLKKLLFLSENIGDIMSSMSVFSKHLESIHSLEMFYGEPTLKSLIQHSKQVVSDIELFEEIYTLFNEEADEEKLKQIFEEMDKDAEDQVKT